MATAKRKEKKPIKTGTGSGHITNLLNNLFWRLSISLCTYSINILGHFFNELLRPVC